MNPNLAGFSPEACKAAGQREKSCPVCQTWGGASGLGSESGPGAPSGPAVRPGVVSGPGPGPGPGAASGPGLGPGVVSGSGPGPGPGAASGPGLGPGVVLGSGPGPRPGTALGTALKPGIVSGPGPASGPELGPRVVLGPASGPVAASGPGPGPGTASGPATGPGAASGPVSGSGAVSGPALGPGGVSGAGPRPGGVSGPGPGPGAASGPGSGPGTASGPGQRPVAASGPGSGPGTASGPVPGPGVVSGPGPGPVATSGSGQGSVADSGPGSGPGTASGPVPGPGVVSGPGPGPRPIATSGPGAASGPGPGPGVISGPGPRPVADSGPGSGPGTASGPVPGPGVVSGPGLGPVAASGPGQGSVADSGPGLGPGTASGPGQRPVAASGPGPGPGSVPGPGAASLPGPRAGPGLRRGSGTGPTPSEPTTAPPPAPQQKTPATPAQGPRQKVVVTGGGGYLGFSLGSSLAKSGTSVILLDLRRPQWELSPGTEFIQADVRNEEALLHAFEGADCVFHVASHGMSGAEKLQKEQIESVNVGGTKLVIDVCVRRRVPRLVYTSTVNVAFGGKPIEQGDEDSVPYFPLEKHMDHYSRTKAIADQLTLTANGTPLPGGGTLRTCVLRPPGIYGPEEQRHLPRVASHIRKRLFMFRFGDRKTRMNWVHVLNLVQAHVLAAEALTEAKGYVASGQAYYINDGESVNLFEWMAPLFEKLGYSQPWIQVPTSWVYLTAAVMERLHLALRPFCSIPPLLTRSEVHSVAVTHTFRIAKARAQLGYAPDKFKFADSVERYVQSTAGRPRSSLAQTLLRLLLGMVMLLGLLALALHFVGPQPPAV